jgi:hypothetical protein
MRERPPFAFGGEGMGGGRGKSGVVRERSATGRFLPAKRPASAEEPGAAEMPVKDIRRHADEEVRKAFPEICRGLIEKAKGGGMGQTKLLIKISGLDEAPVGMKRKRRGKTLSALLMEELKKGKSAEQRGAAGAGSLG